MGSGEFEPACRRMEWLDPFYKNVWEKAYADGIPISGTFELTPRCNFRCPMCYVRLTSEETARRGGELPVEEWLRLAEEAKEAGTTWLCITGGEPLLYPDFEELYRELAEMGFFITLQTNGYLLAKEKFQRLFDELPPRNMKITVYGSSDEVYRRVCGVDDGFTRLDEGLRFLGEEKIPTILVGTVIRENGDDWKRIAGYALKRGVIPVMTKSIFSSARGNGVRAADAALPMSEEEEKAAIRRRLEKPFDMSRKPCTYCRDYRLGYWITWEGYMRFCSFMNEPDIQVRGRPFRDCWRDLLEYEEALDWPEECKICKVRKACFKCAGRLAAECGSPHTVSEAFCSRVKKYYDDREERWRV